MAYILSLEIGATNLRTLVANMTEPIRLLDEGRAALDLPRGVQYVVREPDAERCEEIAGEFYPNGEAAAKESVEPAIENSERDEQHGRICQLARRLGYNDAKTTMLIGQAAGNLAGLERKLLNELDDQPGRKSAGNGDNGHQRQVKNEICQTVEASTSKPPGEVAPNGSAPLAGGFLF